MRDLFWLAEENDGTNTDAATPALEVDAVDTPVTDDATPAEPTVTPVTVDATPAAPATPTWLDTLREHQLPVGKDEQETIANLRRIAEERQALESIRGYIPHVQTYIKEAAAFKKWQAEQANQQQAKPAQSADEPWWKPMWTPPEYNPQWETYIVRGPDGKKEWHPEAPLDVQQKYAEYQRFKTEQVDKFTQNPFEYMAPAIEQRVNAILEQRLQEQQQKQSVAQATQEFVQQNEAWLFELDANGQRKQQMSFNPQTGEQVFTPVLSQYGQIFTKHAKEREAWQKRVGIFDEEDIKQTAMLLTQRDAAAMQQQQVQQPAAPVTPPVDPQQAANEAFLKKANPPGKNTRTGNMKPAEEPITSRNLERVFREEMAKAGIN